VNLKSLANRVCVLSLSAAISACGSKFAPYNGISPIIDGAQVESSVDNRKRVLDALIEDANFRTTQFTWYDVSEAGFNYIDEQCTQYFSYLFALDRRREAYKSTLSSGGQTTNAILTATGASTLTMAVVAQAFGLADKLTDIVAGTFLYQLPPAETKKFVGKLLNAHRDGVAAKRYTVNSPTAAYNAIQQHLDYCLPPTIEAELINHVGSAQAVAVGDNTDAGVNVLVGSQLTVAQRVAAARANARIEAATRVDTGRSRERTSAPGWAGIGEVTIDTPTAMAIQRAVCLPADEIDGKYGEKTEAALKIFESINNTQTFDEEKWRDRNVSLSQMELSILRNNATCANGAKNYLENLLLTLPQLERARQRIDALIRTKFNLTGTASFTQLRSQIEMWRSELGLSDAPKDIFKGQITPDFYAKIDRERG